MKRRYVALLLVLGGCREVVLVGEYKAPAGEADARAPETAFYLEAEDGTLSGFSVESDTAASGGEYIVAPPGSTSVMEPGAARATSCSRPR